MQATVDHVVQWVLFKRHSKEELRVNQQGEIAQAVSMGSMVGVSTSDEGLPRLRT